MSFSEQNLSESAKKSYTYLLETIAKYSNSSEQEQKLTTETIKKISVFKKPKDQELAIKSYQTAYEIIGQSSKELFQEMANTPNKMPNYFANMIKRQATGRFKTDENTETKLTEEQFLTNVALLADNLVNTENFLKAYSKTGLPNNRNTQIAYKLFLETVDEHFSNVSAMIEQLVDKNDDYYQDALDNTRNERQKTIINHIKMAQILASSGDSSKSVIPFAVFIANNASEEIEEELKEELNEYENYLAESSEWGAYMILDLIHTEIAKEHMFQKAVVPLKPKNDKEKEPAQDDEPEFISLSQAMGHYQQNNDPEGVQAVIQHAVIPMINKNGEKVFFPLDYVFSAIENDVEYRKQVVSETHQSFPVSFTDITTEMTINRILTPGELVSSTVDKMNAASIDEEATEAYAAMIEPLENHLIKTYVKVMNNMQADEDMKACAEYIIANAIVSLDNSMAVPSRLAVIHKTSEYYVSTNEQYNPYSVDMESIIMVDTAKSYIENAITNFESLSYLLLQGSRAKSDDEIKLNPLFDNIDEGLKKEFLEKMDKVDKHLGMLLGPLEKLAQKEQEKENTQKIAGYPVAPKEVQEQLKKAISSTPKNKK